MHAALLISFLLLLQVPDSGKLCTNVVISNIRNEKGTLLLSFYKNEQEFVNDKPFMVEKLDKKWSVEGKMCIEISLDPGVYGMALLDDENDNGKMEYSVLGFPKEGFGFSNYIHSGVNRPSFSNFTVNINKKNQVIEIRLKYF
jgi:uncharacterized protein (DUF2141 family)